MPSSIVSPPSSFPAPAAASATDLAARYRAVRQRSLDLAAPLSPEDAMVQSMDDASPSKWHLAHTTWFFERFVLGAQPGYQPVDAAWDYLFNSYYQSIGPMHARTRRGMLSRPGLAEVLDYCEQVDARMQRGFECGDFERGALKRGGVDGGVPDAATGTDLRQRIQLGLQHEQQHQELLLTDIKHAFWCNPLQPAYRDDLRQVSSQASTLEWRHSEEAIVEIGAPPWPGAASAFAYDNESPRHRVLMAAHALASRPVSNAEYRDFIGDGGYRNPGLWLSAGWARISQDGWCRPLYWQDDLEREFTLGGLRAIDPHAPVCHLSYFEADAFARWAGARLPTEMEWEHAAAGLAAANAPVEGNFVESDLLHPAAFQDVAGPSASLASNGTSAAGAGDDVSHSRPESGEGMLGDGGVRGASKSNPLPPAATSPHAVPRQLFGDVWEWTSSAYGAYPGFREMPGALGEYNGKFMCGQQVLRGGSCASARDHLRASYRNFFYPPDRWQFSGVRLARDAR